MEPIQAVDQDFVYNLAASPTFSQDRIIFAAKQSGLYRSADGGQTWNDAYASLDLAIPLPTTSVTIIPAEDKLYIFSCVEGNILRSSNGGDTWEFAKLSSPSPLVTAMVRSPNFPQDGTLLAGTMQDGIFRSTSRGAAWSGWNFGLFDPNINALAISPNFTEDQTLLAGTQSGIFRSINGGRSWRDLDFPIENAPVLCIAIDQENKIFAGSEEQGLFLSQDDGETWHQLTSGSIEQIRIDFNDDILILKDAELQFSKDGGKSWDARGQGFTSESVITGLAAPLGLSPEHPLWVGLSNGEIVRI